jgi:hypothetical protein
MIIVLMMDDGCWWLMWMDNWCSRLMMIDGKGTLYTEVPFFCPENWFICVGTHCGFEVERRPLRTLKVRCRSEMKWRHCEVQTLVVVYWANFCKTRENSSESNGKLCWRTVSDQKLRLSNFAADHNNVSLCFWIAATANWSTKLYVTVERARRLQRF